MIRNRIHIALLLTLCSCYLFSTIPGNFLDLNEAAWAHFPPGRGTAALAEVQAAGGGAKVLPGNVQNMIALLAAAKAGDYRLSRCIAGNCTTLQRVVEGAYPLRLSQSSHYLLRLQSEPSPAGCTAVALKPGIALDRCP